jgi:fucose permease
MGGLFAPLTLGWVIDATGDARYGFALSLVLVCMVIPLYAIWDPSKGFDQAARWEGTHGGETLAAEVIL